MPFISCAQESARENPVAFFGPWANCLAEGSTLIDSCCKNSHSSGEFLKGNIAIVRKKFCLVVKKQNQRKQMPTETSYGFEGNEEEIRYRPLAVCGWEISSILIAGFQLLFIPETPESTGNEGNSTRDAKGEIWTLVLIQISSSTYCASHLTSPVSVSSSKKWWFSTRWCLGHHHLSCEILPKAWQFCLMYREMYI